MLLLQAHIVGQLPVGLAAFLLLLSVEAVAAGAALPLRGEVEAVAAA